MHMRSSSSSNPSSTFLNNNNNFYSSLKNQANNNNNVNSGSSNNINENILKSKNKIIDKEKRIPSSMNRTGVINSNLRNAGSHKQTQSYNNIYGNLINSNNSGQKILENTPDRRSTSNLIESITTAKPLNGKLPNINNIDKLKIRKLINSNNSSLLFKYYKSNSNINNSSNGGLKSQIFNKKNLAATGPYSNFNNNQ